MAKVEHKQSTKAMKSITELLSLGSEATLEDWYQYAQNMCRGIVFSGADDSTPELTTKIEESLSIQQFTTVQLRSLYDAANTVIDNKYTAEDGFQVMCWGGITQTLIQEELNKRLQQTAHESVFTEDIASLLETVKSISVIKRRNPEELFQGYIQCTQHFLETIQQEISKFKIEKSGSYDVKSAEFLQNEEDYLEGPATTDEKLLRQGEMLAKLSSFEALLSGYKNYVTQTYSDYQTQKLNIVGKLEEILQDKALPPSIKMRALGGIIENPDNQAIIAQDSWGEKLLSFLHDCLSIFFTRTQTQSEFYKAQLGTLKGSGTQTSENVAALDATHRSGHSNTYVKNRC